MAEASDAEWSSNANEALHISLIQSGATAPIELASFHPQFTYPIFGDEEQIFGYKDLRIDVRFAAHNMHSDVQIAYSSKFPAVGDTEATDMEKILEQFLPDDAFHKPGEFEELVQSENAADFCPPGKKVHSYTKDNRTYEIWCGELTDPAVKLQLDRMQILVSFFIEGGTFLTTEDQDWTLARWRVFFVYEVLPSPPIPTGSAYSLVGYSTSYRFLTYLPLGRHTSNAFTFPPPEPLAISSLPCRGRISQFLILSHHQGQSHGSHLYNIMVDTFLTDPTCIEITVEDPNEAFDDLRDYSDYARLMANGSFAQLKLNYDLDPKLTARRRGVRIPTSKLIDKKAFDDLRSKNKMPLRQYNRMVELYLLSRIPKHSREAGTSRLTQRGKASNDGDRAFYYWRLLVKQRLWKQHKDVLSQIESPEERVEKLEETVDSVLTEYFRLIGRMEGVIPSEDSPDGTSGRKSKRKIVDEDDEDPDDMSIPMRESKKRKEDQG